MTTEDIKRYEEIRRNAVAKCDEWFISNPDYFHKKAKLIAERCEAWEKESARLNPEKLLTFHDPESGIWYPDATKRFAERKEPSLVNPIIACIGKPETKWNPIKHCNDDTTFKVQIPSNEDDALMIYVTALLILHDYEAINGAGYKTITKGIWPEQLLEHWLGIGSFFDPRKITSDRSAFIEAALRYVQNDLNSTKKLQPAKDTTAKKRRLTPTIVKLIGAIAVIIAPVIGWFLNSQSNKQGAPLQKNISTSHTAETNGNFSPAVNTGPNSTVNINNYLTPIQSETGPNVKEMDVNRQKQSPVNNIQKPQSDPNMNGG